MHRVTHSTKTAFLAHPKLEWSDALRASVPEVLNELSIPLGHHSSHAQWVVSVSSVDKYTSNSTHEHIQMYMYMWKSDCLGCAALLCLVVCLTLLATFFIPSHPSLKQVHCICAMNGASIHAEFHTQSFFLVGCPRRIREHAY